MTLSPKQNTDHEAQKQNPFALFAANYFLSSVSSV